MNAVEEARKAMLSSDMEEVTGILEKLDNKSRVLARTYMTALADRQEYEKDFININENLYKQEV